MTSLLCFGFGFLWGGSCEGVGSSIRCALVHFWATLMENVRGRVFYTLGLVLKRAHTVRLEKHAATPRYKHKPLLEQAPCRFATILGHFAVWLLLVQAVKSQTPRIPGRTKWKAFQPIRWLMALRFQLISQYCLLSGAEQPTGENLNE